MNTPANFLKQADKDPNAILDNVDEEVNDCLLFTSCLYHQDLGNQFTPEMLTLVCWYKALHPEFLNDSS